MLCVTVLVGCGVSEEQKRHDAFCEGVPPLLESVAFQLQATPSGSSTADDVLDDSVARLEKVRPPEGVADEWARLVTAWQDMRDLVAAAQGASPPEDAADELTRLQTELVDSGDAVDEWGQANC